MEPVLPPCGYGVGAHAFGPAAREREGGREEHDARHLGVPCGIERGEIATHAAADQGDRLACGSLLDHAQLAGDGEVLEIAGCQIGDIHLRARGAQACGEESGFAGAGEEAKP